MEWQETINENIKRFITDKDSRSERYSRQDILFIQEYKSVHDVFSSELVSNYSLLLGELASAFGFDDGRILIPSLGSSQIAGAFKNLRNVLALRRIKWQHEFVNSPIQRLT